VRFLLVIFVATATAACQSDRSAVGCAAFVRDTTIAVNTPIGLSFDLRLSNTLPCENEDIRVSSGVRNNSQVSLTVLRWECGLETSGTLEAFLPPHVGVCLAAPFHYRIAPGESLDTGGALRRIASPAGTYEFRVRLAYNPDVLISLPVTVRNR
jgi:hypothetical protein